MGVLQTVQRTLLMQHSLGSLTIKRTYDTVKKMNLRRRRLEHLKELKRLDEMCYKAASRNDKKCHPPVLPLPKMECIDDPCAESEMPLDLDHYTPSDKAARKYQRTWCECYMIPKAVVKARKCYPNRPRRKFECPRVSDVECRWDPMPCDDVKKKPEILIEVPRIGKWPCCKIPTPGCRDGRIPPSCDAGRIPTCCKKRRTKYPSFSECKKELLDPIPPCECEKKVNMCDVYAYFRHKTH